MPTLRYTRRHEPIYIQLHAHRHLPSAVPWISKDRLFQSSSLPPFFRIHIVVSVFAKSQYSYHNPPLAPPPPPPFGGINFHCRSLFSQCWLAVFLNIWNVCVCVCVWCVCGVWVGVGSRGSPFSDDRWQREVFLCLATLGWTVTFGKLTLSSHAYTIINISETKTGRCREKDRNRPTEWDRDQNCAHSVRVHFQPSLPFSLESPSNTTDVNHS